MTVAVRGRVPRDKANDFTDAFNNVEQRLLALERDRAGGSVQYTSPSTPLFGGGSGGGAPGSGGGAPPGSGGGSTTIINITETASLTDLFLLAGM